MSDSIEVQKKKTVVLNERILTEEEFEVEKLQLLSNNIQIVEVGPGVYKTRLFD